MIKHKKHTIIKNYNINGFKSTETKYKYECNFGVKPTPEKLVDKWSEVTCKNCLKVRTKKIKELQEELEEYCQSPLPKGRGLNLEVRE